MEILCVLHKPVFLRTERSRKQRLTPAISHFVPGLSSGNLRSSWLLLAPPDSCQGLFPLAIVARINPMQLGLENMTVIGNELALRWSDGIESYFLLDFLRKRCPCAVCAGEKDILGNVYGGQAKLGPESFRLKRCTAVGGYAIQPEWMDGHSSGIYSFTYLRSLDPNVA